MPFKPYNFKLNTENPDERALIERIETAENKSLLFKAALYHYFEMPPPPPPSTEPIAPAPAGGVMLDYQKLGEVMYQVMTQVFDEHQTTIPTGAPLNQENGKRPKPVKHVEGSVTVEREDDDGGAEPLGYETDTPDAILRSLGMA